MRSEPRRKDHEISGIHEHSRCATSLTHGKPFVYSTFVAPLELLSNTTPVDRVQFETLLSDISAQLIAVGSEHLADTVESALAALRRFFQGDHCGLLTVSDDLSKANVDFASYGSGVRPVSTELDLAGLYPWMGRRVVFERQVVAFSGLADLPPTASADLASFEAMGTKSLLVVPIKVAQKRLHLIMISSVRQECDWPAEYVPRLRLLGEMLVNTVERCRASDRARRQAARVEAAVDAAELGFSEWSSGTEPPFLDSRLHELLGIGIDEMANGLALWFSRMDPESRPIVAELRRRLLACEIERAAVEYRYEHPRRGTIFLRHCSRYVEGEPGQGVRLVSAVEDVTERRRALEDVQRLRDRLERENTYLRQEAKVRLGPERIIGRSAAIRHTFALADHVASTDSTVLLLGETGSGKERFASYIHECSRRRDRPMVRVNCSAIPATLIESELFGREKGAFTGAFSKQVGRFELAHGSTLFLDEIGEFPVEVQVKLLRVIEGHTIERLGNPKPIPVDVRIIAATHRDVAAAVRDGRFREDLYYRLNVFPITVPPLRERPDDIPLLIEAFVDELSATMGKRIEKVDPGTMEALVAYAWPGNVRELRNLVERAMIMATEPVLRILPPETGLCANSPQTDLASFERAHILQVLHDTGWRIRGEYGAAARLGLKPSTLESRLKKLGLSRPGRHRQH
jgi:formate hydrogenlyase transcriptional activator